MDISDAMLAGAKEKLKRQVLTNCSLAKGNAYYLSFARHGFDFVLMFQVVHYFESLPMVIGEVYRVAKPKTRLLVTTSSYLQLRSRLDIALFPGHARIDMARILSIKKIRHLFESGSFEIMAAVEFASTFEFSSIEALVKRVAQEPWSS